MVRPPSLRLRLLVILVWIIALAGGAALVGILLVRPRVLAEAFVSSPARPPALQPAASPDLLLSPASSTPTTFIALDSSPIPTGIPPTQTGTPVTVTEGPATIGWSVEGRPIEVYRFGRGPSGRLIVAGMHGGSEYNTIRLADQLIAYLQGDPGVIPPDVTLYILPDLNPDGEARAHGPLGRANASGVDLNRNWDADWQADWPREGCWIETPVTGGTGPASEPETQALLNFIQTRNIVAVIDYHSAALGILVGGSHPSEGSLRLAAAAAAVSTYAYPPLETGCRSTGGFVDWADRNGIAAVDIELTDHTGTDFEMNLNILNVFLNWKW